MAKQEPTEQYTPNGHKIPIPKRADFDQNLRRVVAAPPPPTKLRKPRAKPKP
jgi:hypothetical protein